MQIGQWNTFEVLKRVDFGAYLDGQELGEILLPVRELPVDCQAGDRVEAFLYNDSQDRLIATTRTPLAGVGDLSLLRVVDVNSVGAFLDWGLPKDLLVPGSEQQEPMQKGRTYLVYVALDRSGRRIFASSKLNRFFSSRQVDVQEGDQVDLVIAGKSDIGYKAVVNKTSFGLLYEDEVFGELETGRQLKGYVKTLRPDGKIDLCLHKPGYDKVLEAKEKIMRILNKSGGSLPVTDKSPSDEIHALFGISKKTYKQAVGALYRARRIRLEADGVFLNAEDQP
ncbi:MAG: GntR family transcriptional regulator [Desulfohalobiaceae bacterium]|nr:GntR family transcriptional regulator [Desulfohalobiaceae bacterium]